MDLERKMKMDEEEKEINQMIMCYSSFPTDSGGVRFAKCQNPEHEHDCLGCPAHEAFEKVLAGYYETVGITDHEALWLTYQFFDIPTAYLCDGEIASWVKANFPSRYKKTLARQKQLIDGNLTQPEPEPPEEKPEQMSIFDFLGGQKT